MKLIQKVSLAIVAVFLFLGTLGGGYNTFAANLTQPEIEANFLTVCSAQAVIKNGATYDWKYDRFLVCTSLINFPVATQPYFTSAAFQPQFKATNKPNEVTLSGLAVVCNNASGLTSQDVSPAQYTAITTACAAPDVVAAKADIIKNNASATSSDGCSIISITCPIINAIKGFFNGLGRGVIAIVASVLALAAWFLAIAAGFVFKLMTYFANELLLINPASNQYIGVARSVFGLFSNFVNLIILFLFVKTGLEFIFSERKNVKIADFISTIAIIAIGVQFSFSIAAAIIALSFNIGYIFLQTINPGSVNPFLSFYDSVNSAFATEASVQGSVNGNLLQTLGAFFVQLFSTDGSQGGPDVVGQIIGIFAIQAGRLILNCYGIYLMLKFVTKFAIRAVTLFFLLITAPIGFVFLVGKDLGSEIKKYGEEWWQGLLNNAMVYPIMVIALGVGARLVQQIVAINSGDPVELGRLNIFDSASYSVIIVPLIKAVIPAIVALGTLYLLDEWIEKNLKSSVSGVVGKVMTRAISGAQSVGKGYRNASIVGRRTADLGARAAGLASIAPALVSNLGAKIGLGGVGAYLKTRVDTRNQGAVASRTQAIQARDAMRVQQKATSVRSIINKGMKQVGKNVSFVDSVLNSDGARNPLRNIPYLFEVGKDGKPTLKRNENSVINIENDAMMAQGGAEANLEYSLQLRSRTTSTAQLAQLENFVKNNGLAGTEFDGMKADDIKKLGADELDRLKVVALRQVGQDAANKVYGFDEGKVLLKPARMLKNLSDSVLDKDLSGEFDASIDVRKRYEANINEVAENLTADLANNRRYWDALLADPAKFKSEIRANPKLYEFLQSHKGSEWLVRNFGLDAAKKLFTIQTGFFGHSKDTIADMQTSNNPNLVGLAYHITDQQRQAALKPKEVDQNARNDLGAALAIYTNTNNGTTNEDRALQAFDSNFYGDATTSQNQADLNIKSSDIGNAQTNTDYRIATAGLTPIDYDTRLGVSGEVAAVNVTADVSRARTSGAANLISRGMQDPVILGVARGVNKTDELLIGTQFHPKVEDTIEKQYGLEVKTTVPVSITRNELTQFAQNAISTGRVDTSNPMEQKKLNTIIESLTQSINPADKKILQKLLADKSSVEAVTNAVAAVELLNPVGHVFTSNEKSAFGFNLDNLAKNNDNALVKQIKSRVAAEMKEMLKTVALADDAQIVSTLEDQFKEFDIESGVYGVNNTNQEDFLATIAGIVEKVGLDGAKKAEVAARLKNRSVAIAAPAIRDAFQIINGANGDLLRGAISKNVVTTPSGRQTTAEAAVTRTVLGRHENQAQALSYVGALTGSKVIDKMAESVLRDGARTVQDKIVTAPASEQASLQSVKDSFEELAIHHADTAARDEDRQDAQDRLSTFVDELQNKGRLFKR